jgi:DNA polymerase-3 subunit beta
LKVEDDRLSTPDGLSTISAFARRVGLTPSALRFYGDCGLLTPRFVEPVSGYRYYAEDQEERAVALRELRAAEMPLSDIRAVLDGCVDDAARIAQAHVRTLEDRLGPRARTVSPACPGGCSFQRPT